MAWEKSSFQGQKERTNKRKARAKWDEVGLHSLQPLPHIEGAETRMPLKADAQKPARREEGSEDCCLQRQAVGKLRAALW